ncbi:MAG: carbohydrate binding domain-containing protein [candidate division WOR-3 bacterium]|nr:carbohydrate binding domain-containing protein [candidate division WOR-3 bacterium]
MLILVTSQLQNTDFENWSYITRSIPFAWDTIKNSPASCSWQIEQNTVRLGSYSVRITINSTASGYDCAIGQAKGVSPSTNYNVSAWVYDNDNRISAQLYVACYDNNENLLNSQLIGSQSTDNPSWQQLTGTYTTPNNCRYMDVQVRTYDDNSPNGVIYIDGISLTTGTAPNELRESFGSYPPSQWREFDIGTTPDGLLQRRTSACPFSNNDNSCFGIKFRQQDADSSVVGLSFLMTDTLDFTSTSAETLRFSWRVNQTNENIPPSDSIVIQISTDLGNSWTRIWRWNGNLSMSRIDESIPLNQYNGIEQVLLRIAFYKHSTNGSSTLQNRYFNLDSFIVRNSYVSRYNRLTNSSVERWLIANQDMMPNHWRRWNNRAPENNGRSAQLWITRENSNYSGNYSVKAFFTTILNPFIEQKFSNPFNSCAGYPISLVDSFVAISSIRFYDNDPKARARTGIVWYYQNLTQNDYPNNYTTDNTNWQSYTNRAVFLGPNQPGGNNFDSIAFRIRFYNQGSFQEAEDGGTIFADSLNFRLLCFVGGTTPVDIVEFPMNEYFTYIRTNNFGIEIMPRSNVNISIYSIDGRKVYSKHINTKTHIPLRSGIYTIVAYRDNKLVFSKKYIVK